MTLPNFIFAGAPKSGSSTLFQYIRQHPEIYMSDIKEPFFFDFQYDKGIGFYERFFENHKDEKIIGEATVWYMSWPTVPKRIYETIPDTKFLFILRNPIERAFSNYLMDLRAGYYTPQQNFGYVIRNEENVSGLNRRIVSAGFYYKHLKRFEDYFDRNQMLILLYEDLRKDIRSVEKKIYEFLGVDSSFSASAPKNRMITPHLRQANLLARASKIFPLFDVTWKRSRYFRYAFIDQSIKSSACILPEDFDYLSDIYKIYNSLLSDYLGVDLTHWNRIYSQ
jgi:hypothetical protein